MGILTITGLLRERWRVILQIHLLFALTGLIVLTPLFGALLQGILALSGTNALVDQDIAMMLLSPLGMFAGIALVAIFLAIAGLELGALQAVAYAARHQLPMGALDAARYALRNALPLLQLTLGLILRVLAYLVPFLVVAGVAVLLLLADYDINYYLSNTPPEFFTALGIGLVLLLLLFFFLGRRLLGWCLVLPLMLFSDTAPKALFSASETLTEGRRIECLRAFLGWVALAVALPVIPAIVLRVGIWLVMSAGFESLTTMALLFGLLGALWSTLVFLVSGLNMAAFTMVGAVLYEDFNTSLTDAQIVEELNPVDESSPAKSPAGILLLAAVVALVAMVAVGMLLKGVQMQDDVLVIAHRGAAGQAPENTLSSIRLAIDDAADWVEIDVQETRDGQVLVVHDSDFMKLSGNPVKVWEGDLAQLQQIDVGSWFDVAFADERPPTLAQVLQEIKAGDSHLLIELKYYGHDQQLEQRVVDLVEQADMVDRVMVMSLKLAGVEKIKALRPDWTTGLLAATVIGDLSRTDVDFLAVNQNIAKPGFIRRAHAAGKPVYVWTVNDSLSLSHWMSMGVDGVITDEPALANTILAQRAQLSSGERLLLSAALFFGQPQLVNEYRDNSP